MSSESSLSRLEQVLGRAQMLGSLGSGSLAAIIEHSRQFVTALPATTERVVDLGSGGGVPGLVIAMERPELRLVLVERRGMRADELRRSVAALGVDSRVEVWAESAERLVSVVDRLGNYFDVATSRGFGPPGHTLHMGARLVRPGGRIVISEPPAPDPSRWCDAELERCGVERCPIADVNLAVFVKQVYGGPA